MVWNRWTGTATGTILCLLLGGVLLGVAGRLHLPGSSPIEIEPLPPPAISRFLNTAPEIGYVGTRQCAACHPHEHASFQETAHSRAFQETRPDAEPPDNQFAHAASGRDYEIERADGQLWHREYLRSADGSRLPLAAYPARFTIGSGRFSRSYLMESDGFLVQSPATWYAARPGWAISPGYDRHNPGFERPIIAQCVNCHVGRADLVPGTLQKFQFHSQAIDCERCHGPGALHVDRHADSAGAGARLAAAGLDATIVNPTHLSRTLQEEICAQCHFHSGATVELRGRRLQDFRPGLRLNDFCVHVGRGSVNREMRVVGHVEQLRQSRCYQNSDSLTCTTCHDPHRPVPPTEQIEHRRNSCLTCHAEDTCGVPYERRIAETARDDCTSCHMPQAETEIPHFAFTHHRIGNHVKDEGTDVVSGDGKLLALDDISHLPALEHDRLFGLAYLQLLTTSGSTEQVAADQERSRALLEKVRDAGLDDPDVSAALARLFWRSEPEKTIANAQSVLKSPDASAESRVTALFTLGSTYLDARQPNLAEPLLRELVQARLSSEDWFLLSLCLRDQGRLSEAVPAAERAAQISPQIPQLQEHLANLLAALGEHDRAEEHRVRGRKLARLQAEQTRMPIRPGAANSP